MSISSATDQIPCTVVRICCDGLHSTEDITGEMAQEEADINDGTDRALMSRPKPKQRDLAHPLTARRSSIGRLTRPSYTIIPPLWLPPPADEQSRIWPEHVPSDLTYYELQDYRTLVKHLTEFRVRDLSMVDYYGESEDFQELRTGAVRLIRLGEGSWREFFHKYRGPMVLQIERMALAKLAVIESRWSIE